MSRPLVASADTKKLADQWHRDVFKAYGSICWLHKAKDPKSKMRATDAAHVVKRSRLGAALAYCSPRLGRPLCRACHEVQELDLDPEFRFSLADRLDAIRAHNEVAKSKIVEPTE